MENGSLVCSFQFVGILPLRRLRVLLINSGNVGKHLFVCYSYWPKNSCTQKEESLRVQLKNLSDELESQRNLHRTTLKRANEAESQLKENQERVTGLEGELLTSDVERDQMKEDKRKVRTSPLDLWCSGPPVGFLLR